ncbi:MAG: DUF2254 domain-containing protein [Geminicoccaceae bacterium]
MRLFLMRLLPTSVRRLVRGFLFIPAMVALTGVVLAIAAVSVDRVDQVQQLLAGFSFLRIDAAGARAVLSTIAGAMMTVLSLVYSLTLIVFTLAAGNIGPRLLESFTDNRVNQVTIGVLGATFLFALIVLYVVGADEVPRLSVATAILLAATSFFWLIYFVHDVAGRVMVDNEIGRTQRSLRQAINRLLDASPREEADDVDVIPDGEFEFVEAGKAGYVTSVGADTLVQMAKQEDGFIEVVTRPGRFVLEGMPIARLYGGAREGDVAQVRNQIVIDDARAPEGDIQFNVHLNVEIALRALSPGINDAYTAISALDHLSSSLAQVLQRGVPSPIYWDADEKPRVWLALIGVEEIVGTALHPLRRAAVDNNLVMLRLIEAIGRMAYVSRAEHHTLLGHHLRLAAQDMNRVLSNPEDRRQVAELVVQARSSFRR